jgi:hypothetical protein
MNNAFESRYLKAVDIDEDGLLLTIKTVRQEQILAEMKWIVYFNEIGRGLVLNKANNNSIMALFGPDSDDWKGRQIELYRTEVEMRGELVGAIRVRRPAGGSGKPSRDMRRAMPQNHNDMDDEIPF